MKSKTEKPLVTELSGDSFKSLGGESRRKDDYHRTLVFVEATESMLTASTLRDRTDDDWKTQRLYPNKRRVKRDVEYSLSLRLGLSLQSAWDGNVSEVESLHQTDRSTFEDGYKPRANQEYNWHGCYDGCKISYCGTWPHFHQEYDYLQPSFNNSNSLY